MLKAYRISDKSLVPYDNRTALAEAHWIDLYQPTPEDEAVVEAQLALEVPTREEMVEIEPSSRLYAEGKDLFLTAVLLCDADTDSPRLTAVTFILHGPTLITVRYDDPKSFALYCARAAKSDVTETEGPAVLLGLLDTIIDRVADILEKAGEDLDTVSRAVFSRAADTGTVLFKEKLRLLGRKADLTSKVRESLVSLSRLLLFWSAANMDQKGLRGDLRTMQRDVDSLAHHADALIGKSQLLLDAIVGMVSIEQNNIIKIFAVLSVVLMPPTLVASIYGMNFRLMPELDWSFGYPLALVLMAVAGALPYLYFKWKRWL